MLHSKRKLEQRIDKILNSGWKRSNSVSHATRNCYSLINRCRIWLKLSESREDTCYVPQMQRQRDIKGESGVFKGNLVLCKVKESPWTNGSNISFITESGAR